ncbi:zf-HC2 domain-containing protein [Bacillus sp. EB106-08-02-XG196]|uniref:anti-sigma factor family protein n=1 Tax=Bacillus sp. EB106-08-02-XG196 TaxID=2737049 RepID=UPI0015C41D9A|nr:zf-HC2 domain-containing protein [Bacillus sp. EB106-08-02-XG196]NWQ41055.1 zf-HC2 domain-containing protein [Bacillus sp. EB106-08-02-XG196]
MKVKLNCSLVEDLYPLYVENELRPENRLAVEEHLQHCRECRELYQKGSGFSELSLSSEETLSKEVDDRIRITFRLRRMKVIAAFLAAVIIVSGINLYAANREKVATLLDGVYLYAESLKELAENPYEIDRNGQLLSYAAEDIVDLDEELLWFERKNAPLLVNSQELDEMAATLRERKSQGFEDETDLKAVDLLQTYSSTLFKHVGKEYNEFHHGYSSYFEFLDTEGIGNPIRKINELAFFYNRYHKLPSEMNLIKEKDLKEIIRTAFHAKNGKVKLEKMNDHYGMYRFDLQQGKTKIDGEMDGYSGMIITAFNYGHQINEQKPLEQREVIKKAEQMLKAIYGKTAAFEIKVEPNKEEIEGQHNLYRFRFTPLAGEYKLHFPLGEPFVIEFDAGTGEFFMLSAQPPLQSRELFSKDYQEKLSQASLETKAEQITGEKVKTIGTGIIYSTVSADYVLVYVFEGKENKIYFNAETGIVERPYLFIH